VVRQRVKVEEVTDVNVPLTERILRMGSIAVGRCVYLHISTHLLIQQFYCSTVDTETSRLIILVMCAAQITKDILLYVVSKEEAD